MAKKIELGDLVEVQWIDTMTSACKWECPEEFDWKDMGEAKYMQTVGYYVRSDKETISLSPTLGQKDKVMNGVWSIPRGCIKAVQVLRKGKCRKR